MTEEEYLSITDDDISKLDKEWYKKARGLSIPYEQQINAYDAMRRNFSKDYTAASNRTHFPDGIPKAILDALKEIGGPEHERRIQVWTNGDGKKYVGPGSRDAGPFGDVLLSDLEKEYEYVPQPEKKSWILRKRRTSIPIKESPKLLETSPFVEDDEDHDESEPEQTEELSFKPKNVQRSPNGDWHFSSTGLRKNSNLLKGDY